MDRLSDFSRSYDYVRVDNYARQKDCCVKGCTAWYEIVYIAASADLLALDRRDLSAKNSRARQGHGSHVQLGFEPDRFAYFPDVGRETRCELDIPALRVYLGRVVALRLSFCSGNERAALWKRSRHSGEQGMVCSKWPIEILPV